MNQFSSYTTIEKVDDTISSLRGFGIPIPQELLLLRRKLEAEQLVKSNTPIYDTMVTNSEYEVTSKKRQCIENMVEQLLQDGEKSQDPCLLLGRIQSGKTDTFEMIIGLCFDRVIDICVVLTKNTNALAKQTLMRMHKDYRFFSHSDRCDRPSIMIKDVMEIPYGGFHQSEVRDNKIIIVCKKQAKNMEHLQSLFRKSEYLRNKKVLIVDDEADFASRNYRSHSLDTLQDEGGNVIIQRQEKDLAVISKQIDDFRKIPSYCRYLQVTATPYCLYLQPDGSLFLNGEHILSFKPRYTGLVPIHDNYIGGDEYFGEKSKNPNSMYSKLFHQMSQKCIDILGKADKRYERNIGSKNTMDLVFSIISYLSATAIRRLQIRDAEPNKKYRSSALVHVEILKKNHEWQAKLIESIIEEIREYFINGTINEKIDWRCETIFDDVYNDFTESNNLGKGENLISVSIPSKEVVRKELISILRDNDYSITIVNSERGTVGVLNAESGELELRAAANIFVGGSILDRGITIKNMLCFLYGRDPKNFQ